MAKTLNQFLEGYLKVKNPDEQKFVDKHVVAKHPDRNGNDDEVFKGSKVKPIDRRKDRHGYNPGEDEKVYEELKGSQHKIDANKNGKVDAHDFKLLRKKKKVAEEVEELDEDIAAQIADLVRKKNAASSPITRKNIESQIAKLKAQRSKMAEEVEELEELSTATLQGYRKKARAQGNAIVDKMKMGGGDWSKDQKDTKTLRKRAAGAQMSGKQLVKRGESLKTEEVEDLEELSKNTLHSYIEKSAQDVHNQAYRAGKKEGGEGKYDSGKILKSLTRQVGISQATRKLAGKAKVNVKEEAEELDELSNDTLRSYRMKAKSIADHGGKQRTQGRELAGRKSYGGRMAGIEKAKVMAKEEAELEEKLNMDKASMGDVIKDFQKSDAPQFKGKSQDKRRVMAIAAKLTAERGGKPLRKEEKLADLLGNLTETHRRTMLSVFDKLNEDNQKKFLEACQTEEGIEHMLDFAISHRGE